MRSSLLLAALTFCLAAVGSAWAEGDAANGAKLFKQKCGICHSAEAGKNKIGPSLFGVVGRKAGSVADYSYSEAMRNSGLTWDGASLDVYLANPRNKVPGTKMTFPGLPKEPDRADVISYLSTLK